MQSRALVIDVLLHLLDNLGKCSKTIVEVSLDFVQWFNIEDKNSSIFDIRQIFKLVADA